MATKKTDPTTKQNNPEDYQKLFDKKNEEFEEKRKESNPDGRLSWNDLFEMFVLIEGYDPRGQQPQRGNSGLVGRQYKNSALFSSKLKTNAKEVRDRFVVLNEIMPQFEEPEKAQEFFNKRNDLLKEYTNIQDLGSFSDSEIQSLINQSGKSDDFEGEMNQLQDDYEDVLSKLKERNDFKSQFLAKCDFDMITKQDTAGTGLSAKELQILDPMLDF